jgi:hypothetical protein
MTAAPRGYTECMERDEDSKTGEVDRNEELNADEAGARAGLPQQGDNPKDTRMGIVNEANFGTE